MPQIVEDAKAKAENYVPLGILGKDLEGGQGWQGTHFSHCKGVDLTDSQTAMKGWSHRILADLKALWIFERGTA